MSKLSTRSRDKLPAKAFGQPEKRAYPMPDAGHAKAAKARASQAAGAGRLSKAAARKIDDRADAVIARADASATRHS